MFTITEYQTYRAEEVLPLYAAVGWTNYTENPDMLRRAFENSLLVLAAREGERLLGILRCVGTEPPSCFCRTSWCIRSGSVRAWARLFFRPCWGAFRRSISLSC